MRIAETTEDDFRLGYWDESQDTIFISSTLSSFPFLREYVINHETSHSQTGSSWEHFKIDFKAVLNLWVSRKLIEELERLNSETSRSFLKAYLKSLKYMFYINLAYLILPILSAISFKINQQRFKIFKTKLKEKTK